MSSPSHIAAISSPHKQRYTIIIPTAGQGRRMKSYGPKSLLKLGEKTVIQHQLEQIHNTFIQAEVIVVGGFECDRIRKHVGKDVKFIVNDLYEQTNVVYSIALGIVQAQTQNVLVVYGDLVFNRTAIQLPLLSESLIPIDHSGFMKRDEIGCATQNNLLTNMMYGLPDKWGQMMFLTGKELQLFKSIVTTQNCTRWFGFEMINEILNRGGKFRTVSPKHGASMDIDTSKDIDKAIEICAL